MKSTKQILEDLRRMGLGLDQPDLSRIAFYISRALSDASTDVPELCGVVEATKQADGSLLVAVPVLNDNLHVFASVEVADSFVEAVNIIKGAAKPVSTKYLIVPIKVEDAEISIRLSPNEYGSIASSDDSNDHNRAVCSEKR